MEYFMSKHILILAGDGIGPEIVKAAEQVLTRVNDQFISIFRLPLEGVGMGAPILTLVPILGVTIGIGILRNRV
jgi:hypothetical protein